MENSEHRRLNLSSLILSLGSLQQSLFVWLHRRDHNQEVAEQKNTSPVPCLDSQSRRRQPLSGVALPGPPMLNLHVPLPRLNN
jgi:hypothetical protein